MKIINTSWQIILCAGILLSSSNRLVATELTEKQLLVNIVNEAVDLHPLVQAAKEKLNKASADAKAKGQALYNPEIALDYESNVENTTMIGLSQTIDWSDKRQTFTQIGQHNKSAAVEEYDLIRQQIIAEFLSKINQFQSSKQASELNFQQSSTLKQFVSIAKQRFKVGDINQLELDLALMVAGEISMNSARIQSKFYSAETELRAFLNFNNTEIPKISTQGINLDWIPLEQVLEKHPLLKQLRLESQIARTEIILAKKKSSIDPTVSINAGKEGDENIYSLGFSMPLFVRNNYSAEIDSAVAQAAIVDQNYRNHYRNVMVAAKISRKTLELTFKAYKDWINQIQQGLEQRSELLQKSWNSGDLSTTEYLVQIQQTLQTRIAAVELKTDLVDAWINNLLSSGRLEDWLAQKN
ncbi:MAG: hypothetical protein DRQ47_07175 [Gammaproteobacteria bacterium]|nr:MAG: hypothetical protein DRQ47_07175 [Gammaproteobacteria bacterium]